MNTKALAGIGVALMLASVTTASAKPNQAFLTDAIQGNLAEISMGQLAQKNGGSDGVRSFGQMLVEDHSAANEKAKSLAQAQGVTPQQRRNPKQKQSSTNGGHFFCGPSLWQWGLATTATNGLLERPRHESVSADSPPAAAA
jgi:predicted outer membrane protein